MSDPLDRVPAVAIAPPLRCYARVEVPGSPICGNFAAWMRPGNHWFAVEYFCRAHRASSDIEIPAQYAFRRVRLSLDVLMSGAALNAPPAEREALDRLELAVQSAGGIINLTGIRSSVVKTAGAGRPGQAIDTSASPT